MFSSISSAPFGATRALISAAGREYAEAAAGSASATTAAARSSAFLIGLARGGLGRGGRRRRGRGRGGAAALTEVDAWCLARSFLGLEVLAGPEVEHAGDHARRERLERVLVAQHRVVVDLARDRDVRLDVGERGLQLLEVL